MASPEIWFLVDAARLRDERGALEVLDSQAEWLTLGGWRLDEGCLVVQFDIDVGHRTYEAQLRFPETYPHSSPIVRPRDGSALWSAHQFGPGGDLCLEIRPDTWAPSMRAADAVKSTFGLLSRENPGPETRALVPSAHHMTHGQRLRGALNRMVVTRAAEKRLAELEPNQGMRARHLVSFGSRAHVRVISEFQPLEGPAWRDTTVPDALRVECLEYDAYVCRLADEDSVPRVGRYEDFEADARALGWTPESYLLVVAQRDQLHAYSVLDGKVRPVNVVRQGGVEARLPLEALALLAKRVGVVGCGSLGSKVATTLARTGVGHFVLLDDDVLDPDNLVRNDLDWRGVGHHKVAALSHRLEQVQPTVKVTCHTRQLGGQESGSSAATDLKRLAECDLIIDATANPVAANILSGFIQERSIPVVWAEVFAGGVGGMIARCRPEKDPPMPLMRRAIENWFAERGAMPSGPAGPYGAVTATGALIADDADVSVIAAHASRMALDVLMRPDQPHHPWSVYVIGMAPCDIFQQPFEVHPIPMPEVAPEPPPREPSVHELRDHAAFVLRLLEPSGNSS